jgi:sugar phosphate isomerase/epimerase
MTTPLSRRRFVQTCAAAGLAAGLARAARPDDGPPRKFTMDLVCGALGVKADQAEAIRLAKAHGFESVAPDPEYLAALDDGKLRDLRAEMEAANLVWGAAALPIEFRGDDATFRAGMERLPALAKGLERAGATRVGTWLSPASNDLTYRANFARHVERLGAVADALGEHGQRLGLEYVGPKTAWASARYPFVHTLAECRELIDAIGRPNVGVLLDSWHWYTAGDTADDLRALSGRDVIACDLNDAPAGIPVDQQVDSRRELPCATGVIDLKAFLTALVAIGYDGPVRAEPFNAALRAMPPEAAVAATAASLRKAFALIG